MIYDKPRDINLRVFPSLSSFAPEERKKNKKAEGKPSKQKPKKTIVENLDNAATLTTQQPVSDSQKEPIIDISSMPIVDGIPMLDFHDEAKETTKEDAVQTTVPPTFDPLNKTVIDVSQMPDIEGIPLLKLPDEIRPEVLEGKNEEAFSELLEKETKAESTSEEILEEEKTETKVIKAPPVITTDAKTKKSKKKEKTPAEKAKAPKEQVKKHKTQKQKKTKNKVLVKRNRSYLFKAASFFIMLYIGTAIAFIIPIRPTYSETEKRNLKAFPEFSIEALATGSYFDDIGTWFSDTFPYREILTKANTKIKDFYGFNYVAIHGEVESGDEIPDAPLIQETTDPQTEAPEPSVPETTKPVAMPDEHDLQSDNGDPNAEKPDIKTQSLGAIIVAGDAAYEYYSFSQDLAPRFINSVNNIKGAANNKGNVYAMVIPTSIDITLNDGLRVDIKSANQKKALNYFNASFKNVTAVDGIYDAERLHRNEYIYFRTDHHWTALGAYYAYEQFAMEKGVQPVPLTKYRTQTFKGFLGTFYSGSGQTAKLGEKPDSVTVFQPFNNVTCHIDEGNGNAYDWDVIKDVSDYSQSLKYLTFIGGDNALTTITNKDNPNGETCIVIKESYGNAFVPFLIPHYSTIYVIDPRHYDGTLSEFTQDKEIDDIIFIANISTTRNYIYIDAMEEFIQ